MLATLPQLWHYQCLMYKMWGCVCVLMLCVWCVVAEAHSLQSSALHQAATALGAALPPATVTIQKKSYCQVGGAAAILSRGHRPTALHYCSQSAAFGSRLAEWSAVEHCSSSFQFFCFRMRAKTSEFLKVLNRAKIEEESKKKGSKIGAKSPFI